jgi:uncharacterized membrane protein
MQNLIVVTFDSMTEAGKVLTSLEQAEDLDFIKLDDTAVVVKNADGEISVHNEVDRGIKVGVVGGSLAGLLIGLLIGGPIASLVLGAVAGAMGGNLANLGIDQQFIDDVATDLAPGSSALFMVVRDAAPDAVAEVLQPFEGQVYYSVLPEETEEELRRVLSDGV